MINIYHKIKENGKPVIYISRKGSGTLGWLTEEKFKYNQSNLIISESQINNPRTKDDRSFIVVVRLDGDNGKYKKSQMSFDQNELSILRDNIDEILDVGKEETPNNELFGIGKKYKFVCSKFGNYKDDNTYSGVCKKHIGTLINYDSPFIGRFFIKNENGALEIIPMQSVIEMIEII